MTNDVSQLQEGLQQVRDAVSYVMGAPVSIVTLIGCVLLGYFVKLVPGIKNKWIPLIVILAGPVAFIMMETGKPTHIDNPKIMFGIVGLGLGMTAWVLHKLVLGKWLDPKLLIPDDTAPPFKPEPMDRNEPKG